MTGTPGPAVAIAVPDVVVATLIDITEAVDDDQDCVVRLPRAGSLVAAKIANITLEFRDLDKRASDGEDVVRLIEAFGSLALLADLEAATVQERAELYGQVEQVGAGGIAGQARAANHPHDRDRLEVAVGRLMDGLQPST